MNVIVQVTYRVEDTAEIDNDIKTAESIEAQRWEMFQHKYGIQPLGLKVEEIKLRS